MPKRGPKVKGTRKEAQALQLLRAGYSKAYVAQHLGIGVSTVYAIQMRSRKQKQEAIEDKEKLGLLFEDYLDRNPPPISCVIDGRIVA